MYKHINVFTHISFMLLDIYCFVPSTCSLGHVKDIDIPDAKGQLGRSAGHL